MLLGEPVTAIVPARGGSKGLPGKNLLMLAGEPLVARAARLALEHGDIDRVIVSSDDAAILAAGAIDDAVECIARPAELAGDAAKSVDVVKHLITEHGIEGGWILLLQPTSPLRSGDDLDALFRTVANAPNAPAAVSVTAHDEPRPEKLQRIENGCLKPYLASGGFEGPRQALPQPFALNGAFYLIRRDCLLESGSFLPEGTLAFEMPAERSANIDGPEDWQVLNAMIAAGHWNLP